MNQTINVTIPENAGPTVLAGRYRPETVRRTKAGPKPGDTQTISLPGGVPMTLCWCPATTSEDWKRLSGGKDFFMMGSPDGELGRSDNEKRHPVKLMRGFWIAQTPVTQRQYEAVTGTNPTTGDKGPDNPVSNVTWTDCGTFCLQLAAKLGDGSQFALPTEAQWEYACRAGTTTALNNGTDLTTNDGVCPNLDEVAWYEKNSGECKKPVKRKRENAWHLYDMHGNVWEWCFDYYGAYRKRLQVDPTGAASGSYRVLRGGSYHHDARLCRSAFRNIYSEGCSRSLLGFRPVRILPNQP